MSTKGQTINDRLNAAKYTLAGQALARCICKATTEELMKPKKKHLDYLAACTYESNVSMLQLANMLIERTNHSNWAVVYKALITVHHLMSYGSERFTQYLASSNYSFQLSSFLDRIVAKGYAMSTYIRRYSNYINQKALSYRTLAVDLCRNQRGEDNILRTMPIERLLETLPVIHKQLDTLLDFNCSPGDLSNSIITASFTLLFHDSIRLFASYNDGIINLFEKYFDLNKKMCRDAFEAYKKFLAITDRVADFLKVAEAINLDRGEIPDFKRAPNSLLDALEQHLISLESNKKRSDNSVVFDTKLAAFPSFSASTNVDHTPPPLATLATEFDSQLSFSTTEENDFDTNSPTSVANITTNSNNTNTKSSSILDQFALDPPPPPPPPPMPTLPPAASGSLSLIQSAFDVELSSTPIGELKNDAIFGISSHANQPSNSAISIKAAMAAAAAVNKASSSSSSSSLAMNSAFTPTQSVTMVSKTKSSAGADLFDIDPPGYSGGSLLTPEQTLQMCMDPSIDPHTQQQLIQIQREQAAHKQRQSNISGSMGFSASQPGASFSTSSGFHNSSRQNNNNYSSTRSNPTKAKQESIFEDLEQTMRQALQKVEKA